MNRQLWGRFLRAYGSPNHLDHHATTDGGKLLAMAYMHGVSELPAYDWKRTRYVLGFGASLFESWCQTIHMTRTSSYLRRGMPGQRVKFVQVSPRFSVTATKADEWVPIRPATYGALALGLGHVLVRDGRVDAEFIREHTFGFDDWKDASGQSHRGFRTLLMEDYAPDKVSAVTEVPETTIVRLAHEMADNRPAISLADGGAAAATNGLGTAMAIHALNALLGNLERHGGMLVQRHAPLAPWTEVMPDAIAQRGLASPRADRAGSISCPLALSSIQNLPDAVLSGDPYPVQALFLYYSNPVFSKPDGKKWAEALRKIPLVVSFSPLKDESTFWADFVLPDATYLERCEVVEPVPSVGHAMVGLRQPVVPALYDTMSTGDVLIRLAQAIGSPVAAAFPWKDFREATLERLKGLLDAPGGSIAATQMSELAGALEKEGGWWESDYPFEHWEGAFPTPSGKFEFFSQTIASRLAKVFPNPGELDRHLKESGIATRGDDLCLPHWEPPHFSGDESEYPFVLVAYRGIEYAEGGGRHLPGLRELPSAGRMAWKSCCEIHPKDAERLGVRDGGGVRLESPAGSHRMWARLAKWVRPGTIGFPLGHGSWPPSPSDSDFGEGHGLVVNASDLLAGILALQGTRVRVRKEGAL
jgi:anaerobic selenocysteine-containing dehydrogenase